jgi:hypothetical protein
MTKKIDNQLILKRLKSYYQVTTNTDLAEKLQIKPNTLANWIKRKAINLPTIITSCEELNPNWIINGDGRPTKAYINLDESEASLVNDIPNGIYESASLVEEIDRLTKIVSLQEIAIEAQAKTIATMELLIAERS